jgi:hypothetical protein
MIDLHAAYFFFGFGSDVPSGDTRAAGEPLIFSKNLSGTTPAPRSRGWEITGVVW